jgi:menaquinone-dependent protoporphyrinogen oxidase
MENLVLVTFATRYGSTAETAQAVAQTLRDRGILVVLQPVREVDSLDRYNAVVLGAALYMGRLHRDARHFLSGYYEALTKLPVALFVPGPIEAREKDWTGAQQQLDKELARFPWLKPVASQVVGGAFDPKKLGFPFKLMPPLRKIPASDARDWVTICLWASDLAAKLQSYHPHPQEERPVASSTR